MELLKLCIMLVTCSALSFSSRSYAGLPEDQFNYIKNYISSREPRRYWVERVIADPRENSYEYVIGLRFRFGRTEAETIFKAALPGVNYDNVSRNRTSLTDTQMDDLFEADLPYYIEETMTLVDEFTSYPEEMKTAFVDSHFTNYATDEFWDEVNDVDKNWVQKCVTYTHDPVFVKAPDTRVKSRIRDDCSLMMSYAVAIGDSVSTYDPCIDDLMFPYGQEVGDSRNEQNDDDSSEEIFISIPFPFFDQNHDSLWVNTNGVVSFLGTVSQFTPDPFPLDRDRRIVAPFWADINTRNGGEVYFREISNPDDVLLDRATQEVCRVFARHKSFQATWMLIATWDDVAFFGASNVGKQKRNTLQCILVTNGRHSFAIYNYDNVTWTTGTASRGDQDTGLGGTPAQVGFNAGDGITYHTVNGSRTSDIVNIDTWSNVDVIGRFMFQIDDKEIEDGGCNTEGVLSVYPSYGYMLGGQRIYVSGPCFGNSAIRCKFGEHVVTATKENEWTATCNTPIFYEIGRLEFTLSTDGGASFDKYRGIYTVVNEEVRSQRIERVDALNWHATDDVTITWDPSAIEGQLLRVSLYGYLENTVTGDVDLQLASTIKDRVENSGTLTFDRLVNEARYHIGAIRLTETESSLDEHPQSLWSDIHSLKWKFKVDARDFCKDWASTDEERDQTFLDDLEPCPCTLQQARVDTGRFTAHPTCNEALSNEDNCERRTLALHCVRANEPSGYGSGQQCCYNNEGNLIDGPQEYSGGTSHRRHHDGIYPYKSPGTVPYLSHYLTDILPWEHCCYYSDELCEQYYVNRPSDDCKEYEPPAPGGGVGDPHFITLDGLEYTFNGHGEFYLVMTTNDTFIMQGRMMELKLQSGEVVEGATVFTAVAMSTRTSDAVQVQVNNRRILDAWINSTEGNTGWERVDFEENNFWTFNGVSVVKDYSGNSSVITVMFRDGVSVQVTATEGTLMMSYMLFGPPSLKGKTRGLMGTWNDDPDDDLLTADGEYLSQNSTLREIHYSFGMTWNVSEEKSLFRYDSGESHETINDYTYEPDFEVSTNVTDDVVALCGENTQCIFDYQVTGSESVAQASKEAMVQYEKFVEDTVKVVSCGFLTIPSNGTMTADKYTEGGNATFACNQGFNLIGSEQRVCLGNSSWSGTQPVCQAVNCGVPDPLSHGTPTIVCTTYNCTVDYTCEEGYDLQGDNNRTCQSNATWDGESPCCSEIGLTTWQLALVICSGVIAFAVVSFLVLCIILAKKHKANDVLPETLGKNTYINESFEIGHEWIKKPESKEPGVKSQNVYTVHHQ
ncbi:sushi domain-containing protein 2-like isoform X2 [Ptychodera flava]|uniref:sushi domain-containing protein 2-like isoform X2 n=1 Tax=Ptychodera flava TaxID=63121 RepID=UPI003969E8D3